MKFETSKMMKWLKLLTVVLVVRSSSGSLLDVKSDDNEVISTYVKNLVSDFDLKDASTHDIVMFWLSHDENSKRKVDDLFDDIRAAIPKTMPVYEPPSTGKVIENRNLRLAAFNIIISSVSDAVSKFGFNFQKKTFMVNLNLFWSASIGE